MGYFNPIYIYGVERFLADAKAAGVDGLIVVDLPPEEDDELCLPALAAGLAFIRLATPTTDDKRLPAVLANTAGFVYYVSITGITGAATPDFGKVATAVERIKRHTPLPVVVGFGVKTARSTPRRWPRAPMASWSAPRSSTRCAATLDAEDGRPRERSTPSPCWCRSWRRRALGRARLKTLRAALVMAGLIGHGGFASRTPVAARSVAMNWISEVVRPRSRRCSSARRRTISGSNARIPGRSSSTRTWRPISGSSPARTTTCALARRSA